MLWVKKGKTNANLPHPSLDNNVLASVQGSISYLHSMLTKAKEGQYFSHYCCLEKNVWPLKTKLETFFYFAAQK